MLLAIEISTSSNKRLIDKYASVTVKQYIVGSTIDREI